MEFLIFFLGFLIGALAVFVPSYFVKKQAKTVNDAVLEQMKLYFENTANQVLKQNSALFSEQNREKLEEFFKRYKESSQSLSDQNKERLEDFFKRFKDKIEAFERRNEENFKVEAENFTRFDMNIKSFLDAGNKISRDTNALVNVMKSDNRTQGHWGEIVLERVLEASGLRKDEEYKVQKSMTEGRPDATIFLPEGRCVYIDAKTSLSSWEAYVNSEDEGEKDTALRAFVDSTKTHITNLAKRDYSLDEASPDYVLMFIPIESCYSMMFCDDCALWDLAWKNRIMPVSPSTLLSALKIINAFHVVDRQNKNAIEISRLCSGMLDKFAMLLSDILKARSNIDSALKKLQGKGNILSQIDKIQDLGGVLSKDLPELPDDLVSDVENC